MPRFPLLALAVLGVAGCGGDSSPDTYQSLADQAAAEQAQAESLGVPTPCSGAQQCGLLTFAHPSGQCLTASYQAYSLVSATAAAASAAAADEVSLATQAAAAAPPSACPTIITAPPTPSCVADTCTATH